MSISSIWCQLARATLKHKVHFGEKDRLETSECLRRPDILGNTTLEKEYVMSQ